MYRFMRPLRPFLKELDKLFCYTPAFDHVMNENTEHAFKGFYPTLRIDYPKIILTKGKLPNPPTLSVSTLKPAKLIFHWTYNNSGISELRSSDLCFLIAVFNRKSPRWILKWMSRKRSGQPLYIGCSLVSGKTYKGICRFHFG